MIMFGPVLAGSRFCMGSACSVLQYSTSRGQALACSSSRFPYKADCSVPKPLSMLCKSLHLYDPMQVCMYRSTYCCRCISLGEVQNFNKHSAFVIHTKLQTNSEDIHLFVAENKLKSAHNSASTSNLLQEFLQEVLLLFPFGTLQQELEFQNCCRNFFYCFLLGQSGRNYCNRKPQLSHRPAGMTPPGGDDAARRG